MVKKYVPVMKTKQGEVNAVKALSGEAKSRLTPFFDFHKYVNWDEKKKDKTPEAYLSKLVKNVVEAWDSEDIFIVDIHDLPLKYKMSDGSHPLLFIKSEFDSFELVPVFCFGVDRDDEFFQSYKSLGLDRGCLRIHLEDLDDLDELEVDVEKAIETVGLDKEQTILQIDCRNIGARSILGVAESIVRFSQHFDLREWGDFIVSASSFPEDMIDIERNSTAFFGRAELSLWEQLAHSEDGLYVKPKFSDYGVVHPDKKEMDPKKITAAAKIRYTLEESWMIVRGYSLKMEDKYKQYHDLAEKVVESGVFSGEGFSWGDKFIQDCSTKTSSTGSLPKWISVDTNHHLTLVAEQIANHPSS